MTAALEGGEWSAARPGRTLPPWKDPVPIAQEAGWAPGPVWTGGKSRPHRDSIPDRPARSSVAIPTEPPGPLTLLYYNIIILYYNINITVVIVIYAVCSWPKRQYAAHDCIPHISIRPLFWEVKQTVWPDQATNQLNSGHFKFSIELYMNEGHVTFVC